MKGAVWMELYERDIERLTDERDALREQNERLRKRNTDRTTRLAEILRLTYHEDMPDHLADAIRNVTAGA